MRKGFLPFLFLLLMLGACQPPKQAAVPPTFTPETKAAKSSTPTNAPTETATQTPLTPTIEPTQTPIPYQVCCPLEDETLDSLPLILANPLKIPDFGRDDGHHGVDFAYFRRGERESIQGIEVYAILPGESVLTLTDNIPYGYTILVETPLSDLPQKLQEKLLAGYIQVPQEVVYQGQCPPADPPTITGDMSVYHLYAHLEEQPKFQPGDPIECGQKLGTVGNTGYSSNPHLHLETRLGPSGANIRTMAFYDPSYTEEQRANYCLWRMSGYYQLFDPFIMFDDAD